MIHWGEVERRQSEIISALFELFFEDRDLNKPKQLCKINRTAGMDKSPIERLLATWNVLYHIAERNKNAQK